ncbi:MAG: hypothetical protein LBR85_03955 [Oscillospiraceae bacterium]|jgi:flagellar motility protein MotE (MotC chaperone)|nr:hypothetical protein [Oscillospiraceae bacterium]
MADATETRAKRLRELDENSAAKGKGGAKPPQAAKASASKAAPGKAAAEPETVPEKKRHPVLLTLLFTSLFFVLLIGAVIAICRFVSADGEYLLDPDGVIRGPILLFLNPEELGREEYYEAEYDDINERDAELTERENAVTAREEAADLYEEQLEELETSLVDREERVNSWIDSIIENNPQGIANSFDIKSVAGKVSAMSPAKAAAMMNEMDTDIVFRILNEMDEKAAGKILDNLESDIAAELIALGFDDGDDVTYPDTRPGELPPDDVTETEATGTSLGIENAAKPSLPA